MKKDYIYGVIAGLLAIGVIALKKKIDSLEVSTYELYNDLGDEICNSYNDLNEDIQNCQSKYITKDQIIDIIIKNNRKIINPKSKDIK